MSGPPRTLLFLPLLLLCSCSGGAGAGAGHLQRLEFDWFGGAEPSAEARRVLRLEVPRDAASWGLDGAGARFEERDGVRLVRIEGGGRVRVPGTALSGNFQQVAVRFRAEGEHSFFLGLDWDGARFGRDQDVLGTGEEQVLLFELPELRPMAGAPRELELAVRGEDCELLSIDLFEVPLERALPAADASGLVELGGEGRRGVGVAEGWPLESSFVPEAGDRLRFAVGVPDLLGAVPEGASLRVELEGGASRVELRELVGPERRWIDVDLDLDDFAGHPTRARFSYVDEGAGTGACALVEAMLVRSASQPRTVLLVTSDTHRADHLGLAEGGVQLRTKNLDRLARRGVFFSDCYSSSNVTSPSHTALLTGTSPRDTGIVTNTDHLADAASTLAEAFAAAGFRTFAAVSANQLGPHGTDLGQGFDRMVAPPGEPWRADHPVDVLTGWMPAAAGQPLFVWLHVFDAHHPYEPPEGYDRRYYPAERDPFDPSGPDAGQDPKTLPRELAGLTDLSFPAAQYRAEIDALDAQVGRLLEHPRMRRAVTAFTADHGEVLVRPETRFEHGVLLPDTLHVPLVLAWPAGPRGVRVERPVEQIDVGRTLLDLAGLEAVPFPGRSLAKDLEAAGRQGVPRFALGAHGNYASVALGRWFLVLHLAEHPEGRALRRRHQAQLFDLELDPGCLVDRVEDERERAAGLRAILVQWLQESSGPLLAEAGRQSEEQLARLRALGYTTGAAGVTPGAWIEPDCDCAECRGLR